GNAGRITSSAPEALVRTPGVLVPPAEVLCLLVALQLAVVLLGLSPLLLERRRAGPPILEVQRHPPLRQVHPAAHPRELIPSDSHHRFPPAAISSKRRPTRKLASSGAARHLPRRPR